MKIWPKPSFGNSRIIYHCSPHCWTNSRPSYLVSTAVGFVGASPEGINIPSLYSSSVRREEIELIRRPVATDEVRAGNQSEDSQADRPNDSAKYAGASG
jgi:hypothetical protein